MRIQRKKKPKLGEIRVITKFLLWPRTIDNETRLLEKADILQVYGLSGWIDKKWKKFWKRVDTKNKSCYNIITVKKKKGDLNGTEYFRMYGNVNWGFRKAVG